jgi:hypothetical protein
VAFWIVNMGAGCAPVKFATLLFCEKFNGVKVAGYGFLGSWFLVRGSGFRAKGKALRVAGFWFVVLGYRFKENV